MKASGSKHEKKQKKEKKEKTPKATTAAPSSSPASVEKTKKRKRDAEDAGASTPKKRKLSSTTPGAPGTPFIVDRTPFTNSCSDAAAIQKFRDENRISVSMGKATEDILPILTFDECKSTFPDSTPLLDAFCEGFKTPTPIQAQCWPIGLSGR